jgi:hypothetical protein
MYSAIAKLSSSPTARPSQPAFLSDETGAVTVDWVVLTAAIVGLGVAAVATLREATFHLAKETATMLQTARVAELGTLGG